MRTLLVVLMIAFVITPGVAAGDPVGDILDTDDDESFIDVVLSYIDGLSKRASDALDRDKWDPSDKADDVKDFYNERSSKFEAYINDRTAADSAFDTIEIELVSDEESETVYWTADVNGSSYENSSVVDSTTKTTDEWVSLCGNAAKNAPDELENAYDEYVDNDDDITMKEQRRIAGRYGGNAKSSFLGHSERCDA